MKILVFGHQGQLGASLYQTLQTQHETIGLDREKVDFGNPVMVADAISQNRPDLVINVCAYTAVDKAEQEQDTADAVNHLGVQAMAVATAKLSIPVIHISTDYVYSGDATEPYLEDAATAPASVYGKTKLLGDQALISANQKHVILRTSWVFGEHGNNFVKTMLRLAATRDELSVVADQSGRPTYTGDIVASIMAFVDQLSASNDLPWGIYHCSSSGESTWHQFAETIFTEAVSKGLLAKAPTVHAIPTSEYPTPAPRPHYSVLNTDKLAAFMEAPLPDWRSGLSAVLQHIKLNA